MRRLDRFCRVPQFDLFRSNTPKLEWYQLPAEVREKTPNEKEPGADSNQALHAQCRP
jgi:hypothetical protein